MRVILPPLDKYLFLQPASHFSILSSIEVHIAVDLNWAPNGSPKYLIAVDFTLQPNIGARLAILGTANWNQLRLS